MSEDLRFMSAGLLSTSLQRLNRVRLRSRFLVACLLVLCLLSYSRLLLSRVLADIGMVDYVAGLVEAKVSPRDSYPHTRITHASDSFLAKSLGWLQTAKQLKNDSVFIRWSLARSSLAIGDAQVAADALLPIREIAIDHPVMYYDALLAFGESGEYESVLALERPLESPRFQRFVNELIALAYIEESRLAGDTPTQQRLLTKAFELRPGDIFATYHLWLLANESGDAKQAERYTDQLQYFPIEAVRPLVPELIDRFVELVPILVDQNLWEKDLASNVVSYLVWQYYDRESVENLLYTLDKQFPQESIWRFALGELYHRRGEWDSAESVYLSLLNYPSFPDEVYLRLGMVSEAKCGAQRRGCEFLENARAWYEQYRLRVPDDLMTAKKLVSINSLSRGTQSSIGDQTSSDDQLIIAELLNVPADEITLGPNLILNGDFEEWTDSRPNWWMTSNMATGSEWNAGTFWADHDSLDSWQNESVRIQGLWLRSESGKFPGRYGYWHFDPATQAARTIPLEFGKSYVLSIYYRTDAQSSKGAALWTSYESTAFTEGDLYLPPTDEVWKKAIVFGTPSSTSDIFVSPLIRTFGVGKFWFDNIELRSVDSAIDFYVPNSKPIVISDGGRVITQ